jgi:hypothetical protein
MQHAACSACSNRHEQNHKPQTITTMPFEFENTSASKTKTRRRTRENRASAKRGAMMVDGCLVFY